MKKRLYAENGRYNVTDEHPDVREAERIVEELVKKLGDAGYDIRDVGSVLQNAVNDGVLSFVLDQE